MTLSFPDFLSSFTGLSSLNKDVFKDFVFGPLCSFLSDLIYTHGLTAGPDLPARSFSWTPDNYLSVLEGGLLWDVVYRYILLSMFQTKPFFTPGNLLFSPLSLYLRYYLHKQLENLPFLGPSAPLHPNSNKTVIKYCIILLQLSHPFLSSHPKFYFLISDFLVSQHVTQLCPNCSPPFALLPFFSLLLECSF